MHTSRTLYAFLLVSLLSGVVTMTSPASATIAGRAITFSVQTAEQRAMADWALARYEKAGLVLPALSIEFVGPDQAACGGVPARAYIGDQPRLKMCWNDAFMLLHELGHIWVARNVPATRHAAFMAMRDGVRAWAGTEVAWSERASEHAANVIAWGLLEKPYPVSRTYPNDKASLLEAFEFLTGSKPLHDGGPDLRMLDRPSSASRPSPPLESGR